MRSTPALLGFSVLGTFLIQPLIPLEAKQCVYTLGLAAKSFILCLLPFVIFGMIFRSTSNMASNATSLLSRLLLGIAVSTFSAVFIGSGIGLGLYQIMEPLHFPSTIKTLRPLFDLPDIVFFKNEWAMIVGLMMGILFGKYLPKMARTLSNMINVWTGFVLKGVGCAIPFFVAGFAMKIGYEDIVVILFKKYTLVFFVILLSTASYLFAIYFALAHWSLKRALSMIQNMVPAALSGLTTMSSAASLPLLVEGVERNTKDKDLAHFASPIAANVHMVGECFADMILAYAVLKTYNVAPPSLETLLVFSLFFFLARFSCAGIPGGGILIVIPLLKKYFCFNDEMASLITTLYLLLDPFMTASNLFGDGALCQWMARFPQKTRKSLEN